MVDLIYSAIASLDGYTADEDGNFDWAVPDGEVLGFINDLERPISTYLYGRRMYETMAGWETDPTLDDRSPLMRDFAELWQAAEKIVYSTTLPTVSTARTRIERDFDPQAVRQLKSSAARDLTVGGPELAAHAFEAGWSTSATSSSRRSWWEAANSRFPTGFAWSSSSWTNAGSATAWCSSVTGRGLRDGRRRSACRPPCPKR
jgi:dihydrofolate reductase